MMVCRLGWCVYHLTWQCGWISVPVNNARRQMVEWTKTTIVANIMKLDKTFLTTKEDRTLVLSIAIFIFKSLAVKKTMNCCYSEMRVVCYELRVKDDIPHRGWGWIDQYRLNTKFIEDNVIKWNVSYIWSIRVTVYRLLLTISISTHSIAIVSLTVQY